jgi:hypothetical protein
MDESRQVYIQHWQKEETLTMLRIMIPYEESRFPYNAALGAKLLS